MDSVKIIYFLWSIFGPLCSGYNILAIFPMPMHSHYLLSSPILNELVERGHHVTVVTPYFQKTPKKNLKEISVEPIINLINEEKKKLYEVEKETILGNAMFMHHMGLVLTESVLKNENVQNLLRSNQQFDLVLAPQFLNEGLLSFAHHFKAPLVLLATMPLFSWSSFLFAHPILPSYVPNSLTNFTGHMSFHQRLLNTFYDAYVVLYHQWMTLPRHRELVKKYVPGQPDLYHFLNNASLVLINTHISTYESIPLVPNVIEIGGYHVQEPKPLPEELQTFLDNSPDGVVMFSMGSNLKSADLPIAKRKAILKSFSKLKQNVLWKFEADLPEVPSNVYIMKWLPQNDVLAHPNIKAFITHGGLLSTTESIYHGVPVIGIPIFADQKMNMANAASNGYALIVPFQELNEDNLSAALDQILNNPKYRNNIRKRSQIMRDRPIRPMDSAIYWIEYVVRHQGAHHLRYSGVELAWYQRNLLDVAGFVILTLFATVSLLRFITSKILRLCKHVDKSKKIN